MLRALPADRAGGNRLRWMPNRTAPDLALSPRWPMLTHLGKDFGRERVAPASPADGWAGVDVLQPLLNASANGGSG